jgi:hypothetical protein
VLEAILPYLVVAGVAALFFVVCCILVLRQPKKKHRKEHRNVRSSAKTSSVKAAPAPAEEKEPAAPEVPVYHKPEEKKPSLEATQIFSMPEKKPSAAREEDNEKTRLFTKDEFTSVIDKRRQEAARASRPARTRTLDGFEPEPEPEILDSHTAPEILEEHFVRHFLNQYSAVTRSVAQDARTVTHHLITHLDLGSEQEVTDTLNHIMVQEALQNAQRTYVMMPDDIVLGMVNDAFLDVAHGTRSETKTILAYDSLKAMPRMEMSHFRALALLLLFHYSRNTNNVDAESINAYTEKYVTPFISMPLPDEYSGYQQLEYLYCLSLENRDVTFGQVLRDSYPLIFSYRGCMKSELKSVLPDWPRGSVVESLYNSYYKLAVVDDSMLSRFYDDYAIEGRETRQHLTALMHSRPVGYDRKEMKRLLEKINPDLARMQDIWDNSMLRKSSLTLMGMYIARIYIRESIGEDFDLSHWM